MGKQLKLKWVTDVIGTAYKTWNKGDIILIESQTSTGKTHFVETVLFDYMRDDQYALIVCNRTNLKRQIKTDLLKKYNMNIPSELEELDKITTIKNIVITSYQAIEEGALDTIYGINNQGSYDFDYIILDECHYIFSDSSFNNKTRLSYIELIKNYSRESIKIFMTATFDDIRQPIISSIEKIFFGSTLNIKEYSTGIDYSYVKPKYFRKLSDITTTILNDKSDDKWIIFISSIDDAIKLNVELGDLSEVIKSGTKNEELKSIIKDSKFNCKVLITTKVLDNGVNLHDSNLKNIVIMAWDKTTLTQMLGRKRIDINNADDVNLYLFTRYKKSFTSKLFECEKQQTEVDLYHNDKNAFNRKYDNNLNKLGKLNHLFYIDNKSREIKTNIIGMANLIKTIKYYNDIVNLFKINGEYAFIQEQLNWLGLSDTFNENNLIEDVILNENKDNLNQYLDNLIGKRLDKDMQIELIDRINHKVDNKQQRSYSKLNIGLQMLGLPHIIIPKKSNNTRYWIIEKSE